MKYNHQFSSIGESVEDRFSVGPSKAYTFYANHFLYVLLKVWKQTMCEIVRPDDTNALFRTFLRGK